MFSELIKLASRKEVSRTPYYSRDNTFVRVNIRIITNNNPVQKALIYAFAANTETVATRLVFDHKRYKNHKL